MCLPLEKQCRPLPSGSGQDYQRASLREKDRCCGCQCTQRSRQGGTRV
ncbi:hypothetical protein AB0P36_33415 [Streptomyces flavidovirens]